MDVVSLGVDLNDFSVDEDGDSSCDGFDGGEDSVSDDDSPVFRAEDEVSDEEGNAVSASMIGYFHEALGVGGVYLKAP